MTLALVFGVTGVWAAEGNAVVKMTYVDFDNPTTAIGEIAAGEISKTGFNKISEGTVAFANTGWKENRITYIQVDASAIKGTITAATLKAEVAGIDGKRTGAYGVGYNNSVWSSELTYETADKTITLLGNTYTTSTKSSSTFEEATFDISGALVGDEDKVVTLLVYGTNPGCSSVKNPTVTVTSLDASASAEYTVKYVCDGTEVKEAKTGVAAIGGTYTVTDDDKASCMFNDVKYIYVSDDAASQTIKQDGSTVITVTFREAEKFAYTLKNSFGGIIKEGTDWEGETVNVAYPRYLAQDGTLYSAGKDAAGWYLHAFDLTQNNVEATIDYTATETTGIVFLSEAENIKTLTVSTAANATVRCSNGLGAYNAGQGDTTIAVLPAGKYKLYTSTWGGTGVNFTFKAGETTIGTFECFGYIQDYNTEEFTLDKTTAITLGATTNPARCIDFVYIQKTGDVALVSTPRKWDFTSMNEADDALLAAQVEAGVWTNQKGRFQNDNTVFNNEVIAINGTEIEFTKGLLFTADKKKLLLGRKGETKNNFMQVQKGASFILPDLAVGDTVRATVQTSSKTATTLAALDAETVKVVEGFEASTSKHACTFVMLKDANVTLKGDNSDLRFLNLEVITPVVAKVPAAGELNFNKMDIKVSANGSTEGDILKDTTFVVENEFNVTVTPKASGNTENRFWGTDNGPQLRMYNGTLTVKAAEGKTINKITFNVDETKWEGITPDAGTFTKTTTWEGEAETVVFTLTKQCRINAITVGETAPAISVAENIAAFKALAEETEATLTLTDAQLTVSRIASNISGFVAVLTDASGSISVSNDIAMGLFAEQGFAEGTTLNGKLTGMFMTVNGIPTIAASENTGNTAIDSFTGSEGKVTATEATVADAKKAENLLKVVELKNITLEAVAGEFRTFTATQGEDQIGVNDVFMNMMTGTCVLDEFMDENTGEYKDLPEFESLTAVVFANMEGTNVLYPMAYVAKVAQDEIPVVWDFTQWSEETVNNLKADAATIEPVDNGDGTFTYPTETPWRTYEKVEGPSEKEPDHGGAAFWYGTAIAEAQTITANGVAIAETDGLLFDNVAAGALAIAVDYPYTSLGTYAGPAYLWIGGKANSFTIPAVKPGSTIEIKLESHKNTDARGVKLSVGGVEIGQAVPTTVETFRIEVPASEAETVDVKVENTNGCHIYTIGITDYKKITAINGVINNVENTNNDVYSINGVKVRNAGESLNGLAKGLYIIGGKKVVIK